MGISLSLEALCRATLLAIVALVSALGAQAAAEPRKQAKAVVHAPMAIEAMVLFDEVREAYPRLFGGALLTQTSGAYLYRLDAGSGNYVAMTATDIYLMGPVVGSLTTPVKYAALADFCAKPETARFCGFKHERSVTVDGIEREFIVYVPWKSRQVQNLPVVFMLHGTTGTGEEFYARSGWRELADTEGFIAVFPTALRHCLYEDDITVNGIFEPNERRTPTKWASGILGDPAKMPLCTVAQRVGLEPTALAAVSHPLADDLSYFDRMVDDLKQNFRADAKRIYVSGFSNGGQMTARLAAERSTTFAALASAAGNSYPGFAPAVRPPSFIYSVGELDDRYTEGLGIPTVPLTDMGASPLFANQIVEPFSTPLQLDRTSYTYSPATLFGTQMGVHSYRSSTAVPAAGNTLHVAVIAGLFHQYPNGDNHPVKMAELLWSFFKPLALP